MDDGYDDFVGGYDDPEFRDVCDELYLTQVATAHLSTPPGQGARGENQF